MRIGELTRTDDGVLGFFVDDDYTRFRLVDKVVADARLATAAAAAASSACSASPTSRCRRHARSTTRTSSATDDAATRSALHLGQTVTLTILMHPAGKALPDDRASCRARRSRSPATGSARGSPRIAPSLRTGPVLVETDLAVEGQVRLPKVSVFGTDQDFLVARHAGDAGATDAILAATQTALLPDTPAEPSARAGSACGPSRRTGGEQ